jgi:prepilin-type N-terminal cleavage/methylation domain-containing protein
MLKTKYPMFKCLHRGEKGFTLIELLVVIAILGIIAAVVVLNISGFFGRGKQEAANTEAHQVQTAVVAYMAGGTTNNTGTVGPADNIPTGYNATQESVWKYLLNPGLLQAKYTITNGVITDASTNITGTSKWSGCSWNTTQGAWVCP